MLADQKDRYIQYLVDSVNDLEPYNSYFECLKKNKQTHEE